jgi:uncharacterized membrane-anchored protein YitT (DUF2179 family)
MNKYSLPLLAVGAILQGIAMALFLFPHDIASGGAAGIAILFENWFSISHALTIWGLNIFLLFVAVRWIGINSCLKTIYTVSITSLTIWFFQYIEVISNTSVYVNMILGAVIFGIGVGILFRHGASSGGLAIIAHIFYVCFNILPGKSMFWMNMSVFTFVAFVVDWRLMLFAVGTQWLATKVLNVIVMYHFPKDKEEDTAVSA